LGQFVQNSILEQEAQQGTFLF